MRAKVRFCSLRLDNKSHWDSLGGQKKSRVVCECAASEAELGGSGFEATLTVFLDGSSMLEHQFSARGKLVRGRYC